MWLSLGVPFITAVILAIWFKKQVTIWELFLPLIASILCIWGCVALVYHSQTAATEYWTAFVKSGTYYEGWTEKVVTTTTTTDKKGRSHTHTTTSYVYHSPSWSAVDTAGCTSSISAERFHYLVNRFGNKSYGTCFHAGQSSSGDGNKYTTAWDNNSEKSVVSTTSHTYENKTQASTVFYWPTVDPKTYGLFEYPSIDGWDVPSILGDAGPDTAKANRKLCLQNALFGSKKQVRMFILIYHDKPEDAYLDQKNYWKGGNKNELTLCVGVDDQYNVQWANVITWCEKQDLIVNLVDYVNSQKKLNILKVVNFMSTEVDKLWERKHFKDFNYLQIEPPWWATTLCFVITIAVNVGVSYYVINNQYTN